MYYNYKCGEETIRVWVWDESWRETVMVEQRDPFKEFERTIREDEKGKFFTWNKNKIYLEDWIRIPMKEIKNKFENKEHVSTDMFCQAILTDGIDNVRFLIPLECYTLMGMFVDPSKTKEVVCKINKNDTRSFKLSYKIGFMPVVSNEEVANRTFYTSDLVDLIKSGYIKILDSEFPVISDEDIENLNDMYWEEEDEIKMGTHPSQVIERIKKTLNEMNYAFDKITYLDWKIDGTKVKVSIDGKYYGIFDYDKNEFIKEKRFYIATDDKSYDEGMAFLSWQYPGYEDTGYFWTSLETLNKMIPHMKNEFPFVFKTKNEAVKHLKTLGIPQKCRIVSI